MASENLQGGEYIAPNASPDAQKFILLARGLMYSDGMKDALDKAIHGGQYLSDGGVPFIAHLVGALQQKLGKLSDVDLHTVVVHLAGSFVDLAGKLGDPDAKDKASAVADITQGVMAILSGYLANKMAAAKQAAPMQGDPSQPPPDQGPPPLLASVNG